MTGIVPSPHRAPDILTGASGVGAGGEPARYSPRLRRDTRPRRRWPRRSPSTPLRLFKIRHCGDLPLWVLAGREDLVLPNPDSGLVHEVMGLGDEMADQSSLGQLEYLGQALAGQRADASSEYYVKARLGAFQRPREVECVFRRHTRGRRRAPHTPDACGSHPAAPPAGRGRPWRP